jgi:hypothetical protein
MGLHGLHPATAHGQVPGQHLRGLHPTCIFTNIFIFFILVFSALRARPAHGAAHCTGLNGLHPATAHGQVPGQHQQRLLQARIFTNIFIFLSWFLAH